MNIRTALILAAMLSLAAIAPAWAGNLPSVHEVYTAAKAGRLSQARTMVDEVLAAKPNSAKAHFVKAEICANQSDLGCLRGELAAAKRIDPGLAFANPVAVKKLERFAARNGGRSARAGRHGFPWLWLLIGVGLVALLWKVVSVANRRGAQRGYPYYNPAANGMAQNYGPGQSGGFGSGLGRSLATGAALGAGLAAGEALAGDLFHHGEGNVPLMDPANDAAMPDLGGQDFGIDDDGWDGTDDFFGSGSDW